jgi:hypothetical protein
MNKSIVVFVVGFGHCDERGAIKRLSSVCMHDRVRWSETAQVSAFMHAWPEKGRAAGRPGPLHCMHRGTYDVRRGGARGHVGSIDLATAHFHLCLYSFSSRPPILASSSIQRNATLFNFLPSFLMWLYVVLAWSGSNLLLQKKR